MIFIKQFFTAMMIFILASTQPASADIKDHLGPLADVALVGVDGDWETKLEGGWFNMINHSDPDGVKYFSMTGPGAETSEWVVDVNVVLRGGGGDLANAGIILNRASNEEFFAFTIGADGTANFITISGDDFKKTDSDKVRAKLDGTDILTVRQTGVSLKLLLNGVEAFSVDGHDGLKFKPTFGIIALGKGRFAYNGFNIKTINGDDAFPSPAKPDAQPFPTPAGGEGNPTTPPPQQEATPEEILVVKVLLGTTLGIFFHEFAHALIGETNLPATGPEEDTADGFSALLLSETVVDGGMTPEEADIMGDIAEYASLYWYYSGIKNEQAGQKNPWQDEHAPDLNRFRNSFCILYGSDSARYEDIANRVNFGDRAKFRCKAEYGKRKTAWETILKSVARNLGPDFPGDHPANTPGGKILLSIQPSKSEVGMVVAQALQIDGFMQELVQVLERTFVWPRDLHIVFRDCDQINAWYDPDTATVTMCYGIVEYASTLIIESEAAIAQGGGGGGAAPAGQGQAAFQYMVGTWAASAQGQFDAKVTYYDNGEYHSELNTTDQGYAQTIGTWSADLVGEYQIMISFTPVEWEPKTICDAQGNCQPNNQTPEQIQIKVLTDNTVDSSGQVWTRTQ